MKNIALIPNSDRDKNYKYTKELINIIGSRAKVLLSKKHTDIGEDVCYADDKELFIKADIAIALGGDGTILAVANEALGYDVPVLGINLGHLGFLAEIEPSDMEYAVTRLLSDNFKIENRVMIRADIYRDAKSIQTFHALNDIVVARASFSRILRLRTTIDNHLLDSFAADGVILSTPTGSTGYSLSAGGPIIDPSLEAMLITPVCPHTMRTRPMAVPLAKELMVELEEGYDDEGAFVSADGKQGINLAPGDVVRASKSEYTMKLIKITDATFYDTIRQKLNERGVAR